MEGVGKGETLGCLRRERGRWRRGTVSKRRGNTGKRGTDTGEGEGTSCGEREGGDGEGR